MSILHRDTFCCSVKVSLVFRYSLPKCMPYGISNIVIPPCVLLTEGRCSALICILRSRYRPLKVSAFLLLRSASAFFLLPLKLRLVPSDRLCRLTIRLLILCLRSALIRICPACSSPCCSATTTAILLCQPLIDLLNILRIRRRLRSLLLLRSLLFFLLFACFLLDGRSAVQKSCHIKISFLLLTHMSHAFVVFISFSSDCIYRMCCHTIYCLALH